MLAVPLPTRATTAAVAAMASAPLGMAVSTKLSTHSVDNAVDIRIKRCITMWITPHILWITS